MGLRRDFALLPQDEKFLEEYVLPWETISDGSQWVLIHEFPTHDGYSHLRVTAAIRMETGYPNSGTEHGVLLPGAGTEGWQADRSDAGHTRD